MVNKKQQGILTTIAKDSIQYGLTHHKAMPVDVKDYSGELAELRATFVTLKINDQLRGCIGTLVAISPLVVDVANNAFSAAFKDPRFSHLTKKEFPELQYHISILDHPQPMTVTDEPDLLNQLEPGVDGIVLHEGTQRSTFLPSVWESLPDPEEFIHHLKLKAGLPNGYWSDTIHFERYHVQEF